MCCMYVSGQGGTATDGTAVCPQHQQHAEGGRGAVTLCGGGAGAAGSLERARAIAAGARAKERAKEKAKERVVRCSACLLLADGTSIRVVATKPRSVPHFF